MTTDLKLMERWGLDKIKKSRPVGTGQGISEDLIIGCIAVITARVAHDIKEIMQAEEEE